METTIINIPVNVPHSMKVDFLKEQLTKYAAYLVAYTSAQQESKKTYRNRNLCGIIPQETYEGEYLEEYLKEKYDMK